MTQTVNPPDRKTRFTVVLSLFFKKPLTRVFKPVPGVHGKRGLERGWQKRLAKGRRSVGGFPCTLQFRNSRGTRLENLVCDSMVFVQGIVVAPL